MMISSFSAHFSGGRTFCLCRESARSPSSPSFWQLPDIWEEKKWRKSSSRRRELCSQTMWGAKPSIEHRPGSQLLHWIVCEEVNNYCFSETHHAIVAPQDTLFDGKAQATMGNNATMGLRLIKDDPRKNNYKQGCSPKPTDGSTSSFPRVKDRPDKHHQPQGYQKWREQEKRGEDEDIASWTKRLRGSEQREGEFLSETTSQLTSSRQAKPRNSWASKTSSQQALETVPQHKIILQ